MVMKKYLIFLCLPFLLITNSLLAANVTAYLTYASFSTPAKGPYLETYLSVIGNSLRFVKNANGKFQGAVDISVAFKQSGEIKNAQKYSLNSPETDDTLKGFPNFIDQQRITIDVSIIGGKGIYFAQIINNSGKIIETKKIIIN